MNMSEDQTPTMSSEGQFSSKLSTTGTNEAPAVERGSCPLEGDDGGTHQKAGELGDNLASMLRILSGIVDRGELSNNMNFGMKTFQALEKEVMCTGLDAPDGNEDLFAPSLFDTGQEEEDVSGIEQMPLTCAGDFRTNHFAEGSGTFGTLSVSKRGSTTKSDAVSESAAKSAAKSKVDLDKRIAFIGKVRQVWKQHVNQLPGSDQLTQGDECNQGELLLLSVKQFVEFLKENEPEEEHFAHVTLKYKFTQYKPMVWVLDNIDIFSSVAEIVRMLVLCSVVVSERGKYGKRKRKQD